MNPDPQALVGATIDEYLVERIIAVGGMGVVYRARQKLLEKPVALKVVHAHLVDDPKERARLLSEARAVSSVGHRGIADVYGFGTLPDGRQYVVMEYLEGATLDQLIQERGSLPVNEVIAILDEILQALGAVHAAGIVHRDLKSENIFLVEDRSGVGYVKLLDFGLARHSDAQGRVQATLVSRVWGTPGYLAPEQARGRPMTPKTDLYALGVIAFEMLTSELPFSEDSLPAMLDAHIHKAPPAPTEFEPSIPRELEMLVLRLLAKQPERRPGSADEVREALRRIRSRLALTATQCKVPAPKKPPLQTGERSALENFARSAAAPEAQTLLETSGGLTVGAAAVASVPRRPSGPRKPLPRPTRPRETLSERPSARRRALTKPPSVAATAVPAGDKALTVEAPMLPPPAVLAQDRALTVEAQVTPALPAGLFRFLLPAAALLLCLTAVVLWWLI